MRTAIDSGSLEDTMAMSPTENVLFGNPAPPARRAPGSRALLTPVRPGFGVASCNLGLAARKVLFFRDWDDTCAQLRAAALWVVPTPPTPPTLPCQPRRRCVCRVPLVLNATSAARPMVPRAVPVARRVGLGNMANIASCANRACIDRFPRLMPMLLPPMAATIPQQTDHRNSR